MTAAEAQRWSRAGATPYVHWRGARDASGGAAGLRGPLPPPLAEAVARDYDIPLGRILPERAINPDFAEAESWLPGPEAGLPAPPPPGTPILGIVDTGLPLSHRALRGPWRSRILAAWQQGAPWGGEGGAAGQPWIPFGRELWRPQIDALIARHARGPGRFDVDEAGLMAAAGLVDMRRADGERELARARAHGAGVASLAAVPDADGGPPLVLVNLPGREALGTAGGFLDLFVLAGLHRIAAVADHLWACLPETLRAGAPVQGYPLVVLLAYGRQAGARHAAAGLARGLAELNAAREGAGRSKLHLVLPAGNDNLLDGHATLEVAAGAEAGIGWSIPPEDATCNFLEIWSQPLPGDGRADPVALEISLAPPGAAPGPGAALRHETYADLAPGLRAYCEVVAVPGPEPRHAVRYLLCTEPTAPHARGAPCVRAGPWRLGLKARGCDLRLGLAVQTDLPPRRGSAVARRARLLDPAHVAHDPDTGRVHDGHPYLERIGAEMPPPPEGTVTRGLMRRGTINAYAHVPGALVVAGHRASDGRPSVHSGTGGPVEADPGPTFSVPTDRAPGAPGLLVAGSADGSRYPRTGTSFAAAHAARLAAAHLRGRPGFDVDLPAELAAVAAASEDDRPPNYGPAHREKIGAGRLGRPR